MNLSAFTGNLGHDPELKTTPQGQAVCNFTIYVRRRLKSADDLQVHVTAWGQKAEFISKFFSRGHVIEVIGLIDIETYQTKSGEFRAKLTLNAIDANFPPSKGSGKDDQESPNTSAPSTQGETQQGGEDDLPF